MKATTVSRQAPTPSLPPRFRLARWITLALGAAAATLWISRRQADLGSPVASAPTHETAPDLATAHATTVDPAKPAQDGAPEPSQDPRERAIDPALKPALARAAECQRSAPPAPGTTATMVALTFAPNGTLTSAEVEGGDAVSESARACILAHLRRLQVAPFEGDELRIRRELPAQR